jgi:hypothetical protein
MLSKQENFLVIVIAMFFVIGLWNMDLSISAMCLNDSNVQIVGLWFTRTPVVNYHLGILIALTSFLSLLMILVKETTEALSDKKHK